MERSALGDVWGGLVSDAGQSPDSDLEGFAEELAAAPDESPLPGETTVVSGASEALLAELVGDDEKTPSLADASALGLVPPSARPASPETSRDTTSGPFPSRSAMSDSGLAAVASKESISSADTRVSPLSLLPEPDATPVIENAQELLLASAPATHDAGSLDAGVEPLGREVLLDALAAVVDGAARGRLILSAAELDDNQARRDAASERYVEALTCDPHDLLSLRASRVRATEHGRWDRVAELLRSEIEQPVGRRERSRLLLYLAEVESQKLNEFAAAESHATRALELDPDSLSAALLSALLRRLLGKGSEALAAVANLIDVWPDGPGKAALRIYLAREAELRGDALRARILFEQAWAEDGRALDAALGVARAYLASGDVPKALDALESSIDLVDSTELKEGLRIQTALLALVGEANAARAARLLEGIMRPWALAVQVRALGMMGERSRQLEVASRWAEVTDSTERAEALVHLADAQIASGNPEMALASLSEARISDPGLATPEVVREVAMRVAGMRPELTQGGLSPLLAAARLMARPDNASVQKEQLLLRRALERHEGIEVADVMLTDLAAELQSVDEVTALMRRRAERLPVTDRTGVLVALADLLLETGDADAASDAFRKARDASPGHPLALRPLARLAQAVSIREAAAFWLEEAATAEGARAAFAATMAARLLHEVGSDAIDSYRRAMDAYPAYGPAAWSVEPLARAKGDALTVQQVHEQLAEAAPDPGIAASHLARSALLRAAADPHGAASLLASAAQLAPHDAILQELRFRFGTQADADDLVSVLETQASDAPEGVRRVLWLRAAALCEESGAPERALSLYHRVSDSYVGDIAAARGWERCSLQLGEYARVADRYLSLLKSDTTPAPLKARSLFLLARLDLNYRHDSASATLFYQSLIEEIPNHVLSLRNLQRHFAEQGRRAELFQTTQRLTRCLLDRAARDGVGQTDAGGQLRYALGQSVMLPDVDWDVMDTLVLDCMHDEGADTWLLRRGWACAERQGDHHASLVALHAMQSQASDPQEKAALGLEVLSLRQTTGTPDAELISALEDVPGDNAIISASLARLYLATDQYAPAAEWTELAASEVAHPEHAAELWHTAACLWLDSVHDVARGLAALHRVSEIDICFADTFTRLRQHFWASQRWADLLPYVQARIEAGGPSEAASDFYMLTAQLHARLGNHAQQQQSALEAALTLQPQRLDALRELASLAFGQGDYELAADVLIKIGRVEHDKDQLVRVFSVLGDIYDVHRPDPERACTAFARVVALDPDNNLARERLAAAYRKAERYDQAVDELQSLASATQDDDRRQRFLLAQAECYEQTESYQQAEHVLEQMRRGHPADMTIIRALRGFHQRRGDHVAESMHVNRAIADLRARLIDDMSALDHWLDFHEVSGWKQRPAARLSLAAVAAALGVSDPGLPTIDDTDIHELAKGASATRSEVGQALAPDALSAAGRRLFEIVDEGLAHIFPEAPETYRIERLPKSERQRLAELASCVAAWCGVAAVRILHNRALPHACLPAYDEPFTIVVGSELIDRCSDDEMRFLLVRAVQLATNHLATLVRVGPEPLADALVSLASRYTDDAISRESVALPERLQKKLYRSVPRKKRPELRPLLLEVVGEMDFDIARLRGAALSFANRSALIATGSLHAALSALARMYGVNFETLDRDGRIRLALEVPELRDLILFTLSDTYAEIHEMLDEVV